MVILAVPNISTSSSDVISKLSAIKVDNVFLLHVDSNKDVDRTVFSIASNSARALEEYLLKLINSAYQLIDFRNYRGVHPAVGVVDVLPLVPYSGISAESLELVLEKLITEIKHNFSVPVHRYGNTVTLHELRKNGVEAVSSDIKRGAICVTVRPLMVAYNINIDTQDLKLAKSISSKLRKLATGVEVMAWELKSKSQIQISTNVRKSEICSIFSLFEDCQRICGEKGVQVQGSELIGLISEKAFSHICPAKELGERLKIDNFNPFERVLELKLGSLGLL